MSQRRRRLADLLCTASGTLIGGSHARLFASAASDPTAARQAAAVARGLNGTAWHGFSESNSGSCRFSRCSAAGKQRSSGAAGGPACSQLHSSAAPSVGNGSSSGGSADSGAASALPVQDGGSERRPQAGAAQAAPGGKESGLNPWKHAAQSPRQGRGARARWQPETGKDRQVAELADRMHALVATGNADAAAALFDPNIKVRP